MELGFNGGMDKLCAEIGEMVDRLKR